MAAVAPSAEQTSELLQNLSLDSKPKGLQIQERAKKTSKYQCGAVDSTTKQIPQNGHPMTPFPQDSVSPVIVCHPYPSPYYYAPGYTDSETSWDDYSRYPTEGIEVPSGVYPGNGSMLYGSYGYALYALHSPTTSLVPTMGSDGQLYAPQHYQYPAYFQPPTPPSTFFSSPIEPPPSTTNDHKTFPSKTTNSKPSHEKILKANGNSTPYKPSYRTSRNFCDEGKPQDSRYSLDVKTNFYRHNSTNMGFQPKSTMTGMGTNPNFLGRIYPITDPQIFSSGDNDFAMNEMNRGPRGNSPKYPKSSTQITTVDIPNSDQYSKPDLSEVYPDAKFYVVKSYSEDDVHKSIKYKVWASTPTGNKKLDAAYSEAQQKPNCPVFLFFSVNGSGQFVGLAEMVGRVDFEKNVEYWQQDKWTGCFPVKWHIVRDVPNSMLKHITLENNENKPVTNSRDTQEVKMGQGLMMLKVFREHSSNRCILDDFEFYEIRQKCIQSKKEKLLLYRNSGGDHGNGVVEGDSGNEG